MIDYKKYEKLIEEYSGPKFGIVVAGGGGSIANITTIPGASKIIHEIIIPYSVKATRTLVLEETRKSITSSVSQETSELLLSAAKNKWGHNIGLIACTSAITTNRWRRGQNHAWISMLLPSYFETGSKNLFHLELTKMSEEEHNKADGYISWKRRSEDREISDFILDKIFRWKDLQ